MNRSMLNRLPDIITLARQRARELWTCAPLVRPGHRQPPWSVARVASDGGAGAVAGADHRVSLLCGDDLSVMSGLLSGQAQDGPLAGRVSMVWLSDSAGPASDRSNTHQGSLQVRARRLIELSTRLFLARDLLVDRGALVVTTAPDPDRCAERLLGAVFEHAQALPSRREDPTDARAYLAGASMPERLPAASGATLLGELARTLTGRHDHVLVMGAQPAFAAWVAALERRWVLAQSEPQVFAVLREQVVARQMELARQQLQSEATHDWPAHPLNPARRRP